MSLPQSALPCSSHLISAPCTDFTTYISCTITLLFALSKHTHTHKHKITILHYPSSQAQEHYIFSCTLHTSSTRSLFTFHFPPSTDTVKIIALCTIGSDPFLHLETLCVNMFSLCVCICDLCMYVGEVYKCICVFVYVYKLLDDLNFPLV